MKQQAGDAYATIENDVIALNVPLPVASPQGFSYLCAQAY